MVSEPRRILDAVEQHFRDVYNHKSAIKLRDLQCHVNSISEASKAALEMPFTLDEVFAAVKECDGSRAPGPDGFNLNFFKKKWGLVKDDLMKLFHDFYQGHRLDAGINHAFITLIPKIPSPVSLNDYRPISLVGSIYKIVAKVLASRLSSCIREVIGENQFAFIRGKQILDCPLIANEIIDSLRKSKKAGIIFKADFQRAYDTVDWDFLDFMLAKMGFGNIWRSWIGGCIRSASVSILVNGTPTKRIFISRGLRQGCPLSPMLFNIVVEGLSCLINKATSIGLFRGIEVGTSASVSHIQYADDTMIFAEGDMTQLLNVKPVLRCFQLMSGLKLNLKKSSLFGVNVEPATLESWALLLHCSIGSFPSDYLGIPLGNSRNSIALWRPVVERVKKRLCPWKSNYLSFGGRLTIIRSVLASLPSYFMSIFRIPMAVSNELNSIVSRFFWGESEERKKLHMVCGDTLRLPKEFGGVGCPDFNLQNSALLNKWIVRFANEKDALWSRVIRAKLGEPESGLLPLCPSSSRASWAWKSIVKPLAATDRASLFFKAGLRLKVGDGSCIKFWEDKWIGNESLKVLFPRVFGLALKKQGNISEFGYFENSNWYWNVELRRSLFDWERQQWDDFCTLLGCQNITESGVDCVVWDGSGDGSYSAKVFKHGFYSSFSEKCQVWKEVWSGLVPHKIEVFVWQLLKNRVATKVELAKRGLIQWSESFCVLCGRELESNPHLFFSCDFAWQIWQRTAALWGVSWILHSDPKSAFMAWKGGFTGCKNTKVWLMFFFAVVWSIWLSRNDMVFNGKVFDIDQLFFSIKLKVAEWFKAKWSDACCSFDDVLRRPDLSLPSSSPLAHSTWSPPALGFLKYNVDASSKGAPGPAGIGGLLRDNKGSIYALFSLAIAAEYPLVAEFLAIKEACSQLIASKWFHSFKFIIESDCQSVVEWFSCTSSVPQHLKNMVLPVVSLANQNGLVISHVHRTANSEADILAKNGVNRVSPLFLIF